MRFAVFTHVPHYLDGNSKFAYAPYVREMDLWFDLVSEIDLLAPLKTELTKKDKAYLRSDINLTKIPSISFLGLKDSITSLLKIPMILIKIFRAMSKADHLHIRCPGNIGLLACILQVFFPGKNKTFKYAGNWDPRSIQPLSYKIQKYIISNKLITRRAKVLVYGKWERQSSNIIPFFTASYSSEEICSVNKNFSDPFRFLFVGSLTTGKRPLLAVKIIHQLYKHGINVHLDIYGTGSEYEDIKYYLSANNLEGLVSQYGDQEPDTLKVAYKNSHFSILPSKSEGWPKALAEAMFFGCIPIATRISCVPWMLGEGKRGILINPDLSAVKVISEYLNNERRLEEISNKATKWSREYTLEAFKSEIEKLL